MTDHQHPTTGPAAPPTPKQQRYLRTLATARGITFTVPKTKAQASREIRRLLKYRADPIADQRREIRAVQDDLATHQGDSARITDTEYSRQPQIRTAPATATWKRGQS